MNPAWENELIDGAGPPQKPCRAQIADATHRRADGGRQSCRARLLLNQITQLALFACESGTPNLHDNKSSLRSDLRAAALPLIKQNLANPGLSVAQLRGQLGCSRATLYRASRRRKGMNASEYRKQLRRGPGGAGHDETFRQQP